MINSTSQLNAQLELLDSLQEDLNKLYSEVKDLYYQKEYSDIKLLLLEKTHKIWIEYKNLKSELDASEYIGLPEYKLVKVQSQIESIELFFDYLLKIKTNITS